VRHDGCSLGRIFMKRVFARGCGLVDLDAGVGRRRGTWYLTIQMSAGTGDGTFTGKKQY
jgi:hypothetical protein